MPLQKQTANINFSQGLDTKTDPYQIPLGKFSALQNSVFTKAGLLQKRNGFQQLSPLPNSDSTYLTTFNGGLTAIGNEISTYSQGSGTWTDAGQIQPLSLGVLPLVKNNFNQIQTDSTIASNGLLCEVYTESLGSSVNYKYTIADSTTGQTIIAPTNIPVPTGTVSGSPRVFLLNNYFILVFTTLIGGTSHLQYITISSITPTILTIAQDIASAYTPTQALSFDAIVVNDSLYVAYNTVSGGQAIKVTYLTKQRAAAGQTSSTPTTFAGQKATIMSMSADTTGSSPIIWASYYDSSSNTGHSLTVNVLGNQVLAPTATIALAGVVNITAVAQNASCQIYYEVTNAYSYDGAIASNYVNQVAITQAGSVGSTTVSMRSLGLASKAFLVNSNPYYLGIYYSSYQPTYFLINALTKTIAAKLAYSNAGMYLTYGLPSASVNGDVAQVSYLYKDLIESVNKAQGAPASAAIYAQTGINLVAIDFTKAAITSVEIGNNLNITGGFIWGYDGSLPVENGFFVWPDNVEATWSATGGSIHAQPDGATNASAYFYQVTYEWTDNQGNIFRSAPSIPVAVTTTGSGTAGSITINIPTLRLSYKPNVKIVIYRWSVANPIYYQVTSITNPTLNNPAVDSIAYVDTQADASIIGNSIIYTTGGVIENIAPPAAIDVALFNNRLFLLDAEDRNLLWYSKQVIEATPVDMSDLLTLYIAPTSGAQGSTGPTTALGAMDDKLIIFKRDAIYYINGSGPDNTGSNGTYSDPIFITSSVGCANPQSIVLMPSGLMFQSDKGIWLLGRGLDTTYIGAPVEQYNANKVVSAQSIPGTNQVRFILDNNVTLMYDYYYGQWGTFNNSFAVSSTLYQNLHTYLNSYGSVFQETPGEYLDGSSPVLMSFTTSWINIAGLQGYERFYFANLLGTYYTPFNLAVNLAYDYNPSAIQQITVTPDNYVPNWGGEAQWGSGAAWGGPGNVFSARLFPQKQKCQSFQLSVQEVYDSQFGTSSAQGLTLSGLALTIGVKRGYRTQSARRSYG